MRHYVIVLDFGYADDPNVRSTVHDLAEITMREYGSDANATVLAQTESYRRLKRIGFPEERLHVVSVSQSATDGTKGGGSYHVLRRASQMMATFESERLGEAVAWPFTGLEATVIAHWLHLPLKLAHQL